MKKIFPAKILVINILMMLACKSNDFEMLTQINQDGSCSREFLKQTDSAFFADSLKSNPFPVILDSSWNLVRFCIPAKDSSKLSIYLLNQYEINVDSTKIYYFARATKHYPSVVKMAETFRFNNCSSWDSVVPVYQLNKRFLWFYTSYVYSETYPKVNPFNKIPISNYLTEKEVETWFGESTELYKGLNGQEISHLLVGLEKKADEWMERNYYEELFGVFYAHFKEFRDLPINERRFLMAKDSILSYLKDTLGKGQEKDKLFGDDLYKGFDLYFHTHAFSRNHTNEFDSMLMEEIPDWINPFMTQMEYKLIMPGKVISTNAPLKEGDTLVWNVDAYRFFINDYSLRSSSRKANYWAYLLTGLLIMLIAGGIILKKRA